MMNLLNDVETRIFLSAMSRETDICREVDERWPGGVNLEAVCHDIIDKVYNAAPVEYTNWYPTTLEGDEDVHLFKCGYCGHLSAHGKEKYCPECGRKVATKFKFEF